MIIHSSLMIESIATVIIITISFTVFLASPTTSFVIPAPSTTISTLKPGILDNDQSMNYGNGNIGNSDGEKEGYSGIPKCKDRKSKSFLSVIQENIVVGTRLTSLVVGIMYPFIVNGLEIPMKLETNTIVETSNHILEIPSSLLASAQISNIDLTKQISMMDEDKLRKGLSSPSTERPQIKIPDKVGSTINSPKDPGRIPLVQGLIYLVDNNLRPDISDIIVISVGTVKDPDLVLLGAKAPVAGVRFPFQFSLFDANIVKEQQQVWEKAQVGDLIVTARVCSQDMTKLPCTKEESTFFTRGIAKLIGNLPGMPVGELVRTAASLDM